MKYFGEGLSEDHKELNKIIRKPENIEQAKELFLEIHAKLHQSVVSDTPTNEVDKLIEGLNEAQYAIMPTSKDETIAWVLWHIARIEDLTMGILVSGNGQIWNEKWNKRMSSTITDTGNALSDDEIIHLSKSLTIPELLNYRNEVGKRTRQIVKGLTDKDMKRVVSQQDIQTILQVGGVTKQQDSVWLLDFWSKKDIAGILLMPPTRHVMLHLNDCCKWKEQIIAKKKFYKS
jgi:DinB superfamily